MLLMWPQWSFPTYLEGGLGPQNLRENCLGGAGLATGKGNGPAS